MTSLAAAGDVELPQGYTLAEVDRLARVAAGTALTHTGQSMAERIDDAWTAIIERLYADPDTLLEAGQLVWVGKRAIYRGDRDYERQHGVFKRDRINGFGSMPAFQQYWWRATVTIENGIVERLAFAQIWGRLSPAEQEAVVAVATWGGDQKAAAEALGKPHMRSSLMKARQRFLGLWHEHETPSKHWGYDHPGPGVHAGGFMKKLIADDLGVGKAVLVDASLDQGRCGMKHYYVSTYCLHELHDGCRRTCKHCRTPCLCPCHAGQEGDGAV